MPERNQAEYRQHRPEQTALFPLVRDNLEGFLEQCRATYKSGIPRYAEKELREYLKCGIQVYGFARAQCEACGHELLLAFSCKRRGVCPSCNARRMSDTAARLVDGVLPDVRLRQWVLSVPFELRLELAKNPQALSACGRIFVEEIFRWQRQIALRRGFVLPSEEANIHGGAVNFPQRFGGSLNLNVHYHVVAPDAVYLRASSGQLTQELLPKPSRAELEEIAHNVHIRVFRWLARQGLLDAVEEPSSEGTPGALEACLSSSMGLGDLATLKGNKVARAEHHSADSVSKRTRSGEFNIHASVTARSPAERERLVRYCARAPLSLERLSVSRCGKVIYKLRKPIRGKTHRVMEPYQFLARLCALIPPPRHPLIRFHGVLAPHSSLRSQVVPHKQEPTSQDPAETQPAEIAPTSLAALFAPTVRDIKVEQQWQAARLDWATLLRRVYNIDALKCSCGGRLKFVALVEDRDVVRAELLARGLPADLHLPSNPPQGASHEHVDEEPTDEWDQRPEAPHINPRAASRIWEDP